MLSIIAGYLMLALAWNERRKFWYWWIVSWAVINFGTATYMNL